MKKLIDLGPTALRYHRYGAPGPDLPLVLLHPWFGCDAFWDDTVKAFAGRTCLVPDMYSIGDGNWAQFVGPDGLAAAVTRMLDAEEVVTCDLAGNSMGGIVSQMIASAAPTRVERLVLIGTGATAADLDPAYRASIDEWLRGDVDGSLTAAFVRRLLASDPPRDRMIDFVSRVVRGNPEFIGATLTSALGMDLRPRLSRITARTLIVRGSLDAGRTAEHVRALRDGIASSATIEIAGAGHSPMVDSFEAFLPIFLEFLDAV